MLILIDRHNDIFVVVLHKNLCPVWERSAMFDSPPMDLVAHDTSFYCHLTSLDHDPDISITMVTTRLQLFHGG